MTSHTAALDQARADLATIENELDALDAAKSQASRAPAMFNEWRAKFAAATAERERLIALIDVLEQEVAALESSEAEKALRKRYTDRKAANVKLAARIKTDVATANAILLALVRDVAEAAEEDSRINGELPDDLEPLVPADFIARGRPGLDRKELKTTRTWMWVNARSGGLIGDQDSVRDCGNGHGRIGDGSYVTNCVASLFDEIEYFPSEPAQRPELLWNMRLPRPDGPGFAFDGARCVFPASVLVELERGARAGEPRERPVEIELRPVPSVAAGEEVAA